MNFTVYKSSAGSGKTYTLVREYLRISIGDPNGFRSVLAVTFTNKAANEMKERVITYLKEIADFENNSGKASITNMLPQLIEELKLTKEEIAERAKTVLGNILHNYSDFAISTIDSFMHRIIRTFAYDLHLAQDFDVEMDTDELMSKITDILISEVGNNDELTKILVKFIQTKTEDEKSWHIENDLQKMAKRLTTEDAIPHLENLRKLTLSDFEAIFKEIRAEIAAFENRVISLATSVVEKIDLAGIPDAAFYQGRSGISVYFRNIANKRFDKVLPNSYVSKTVEEDKWYAGKATAVEKSAIDSVKHFISDGYVKLQDEINFNYKHYVLLNEIWKNIYPLAVLSEIEKILEEYKKSNKIIHISEFNRLIAGIVADQPVPFIYERVGEKYRHFLIDEFQDTSILQWHNLIPLVENSLAGGNFNMVVGDGKQAIYRWRGGEVEQFVKLPEIYKKPDSDVFHQREAALKRNYKNEVLKSNFRSKAEIVQFNNDFFTVISTLIGDELKPIYDGVYQEFRSGNRGGMVQIQFLNKDENELSDLKEINLDHTLEIVGELLDDGYQLKDIAILCRKNDEANLMASFLLSNKYNVISSESLLIKNSSDVRFLIDVMSYLNDRENSIAKAGILHYLSVDGMLYGDLHNDLNVINVKEQAGGKDLFSQEESFEDVLRRFGFNAIALKRLPLYDMVEEIIRNFGLTDNADVYVQFFLDNVMNFTGKNNSGLPGFLEWWEKKKDSVSVVVPEGIDAIRIMTIHKSKGLEFPVVIYPFAGSKMSNGKEKLWVYLSDKKTGKLKTALLNTGLALEKTDFADLYKEEKNKSFLDLLNLVYVVMTRPAERLYVLTELPPKNRDKTDSVPKFFHYFLKTKGLWNEEQPVYTFGERMKKSGNRDDEDGKALNIDKMISASWRKRMLLSLRAPEHWDVAEPESGAKYGTLIHNILSKIKTESDVEGVINGFLQEGVVKADEADEIRGKIRSFLDDPESGKYFNPGLNVKTEAEILLPDGKTIRPDRIILEGPKATVIDFKTGQPKESHKKQIENYKTKLKELGYEHVEGVLLYLS